MNDKKQAQKEALIVLMRSLLQHKDNVNTLNLDSYLIGVECALKDALELIGDRSTDK